MWRLCALVWLTPPQSRSITLAPDWRQVYVKPTTATDRQMMGVETLSPHSSLRPYPYHSTLTLDMITLGTTMRDTISIILRKSVLPLICAGEVSDPLREDVVVPAADKPASAALTAEE
mgnify:CR=1 FL=1